MSHPIAQTILNQLGGNKFLAMTGAKNLVAGERELQMRFGLIRRTMRIELAANDTYRVRLYRLTRGLEVHTVAAQDDVTNEMLVPVVERMTGLRTSLEA
jgi:hypothetical protein